MVREPQLDPTRTLPRERTALKLATGMLVFAFNVNVGNSDHRYTEQRGRLTSGVLKLTASLLHSLLPLHSTSGGPALCWTRTQCHRGL